MLAGSSTSRKRQRASANGAVTNEGKARKVRRKSTSPSEITPADILLLEEQVLESREHYNNIARIQILVDNAEENPKTATIAAVALCRVFCRLIAGEKLVRHQHDADADVQMVQWLKARLRDYVGSLMGWIGCPDGSRERSALTLLMGVVKAETSQDIRRSEQAWRADTSTFRGVVKTLLESADAGLARQEFVEKYVEQHDDVRFYTFLAVKLYFSAAEVKHEQCLSNTVDLLLRIEGVPESEEQLEDWYGTDPEPSNHQLLALNAHRKTAQECWLSVFRSPLAVEHRKKILGIMTSQILPWFPKRIEVLVDFLTDSFNASGSVALLALSGIFYLMTESNLDYPDFYLKLYSLLDEDIMHSKHRSRFFGLLDQFMSSSHLPAAMVASFIKRLARLSLHSPPGGIVWVVPWVYNMFRKHPACTFMLHRPYHPAHAIYSSSPNYIQEGLADPFSMTQRDPMLTNAIDSSLWEFHTLQNHWHPNVATLAKILSEQFTKREYQLDDFSHHSYTTLIEAELAKEIKKKPEVQWDIPKRIVTSENGGLNELGSLLQSAILAS